MSKSPRSTAVEEPRERVFVLIDVLKQQLSELEALRKKVAESASAAAAKRSISERPHSTSTTRCSSSVLLRNRSFPS